MAARWLLVLVFAWSAGGKLFWPTLLRNTLLATGMIPDEWLAPLVWGLPACELALAILLAARLLLIPALLGSIFLSCVFAGVHVYLIVSGTIVPCGCAGVALDLSGTWFHAVVLGVSGVMLFGSLFLLFAGVPRPAPRRDQQEAEASPLTGPSPENAPRGAQRRAP